jgi:hypothetical protein
LFLLKKVDGEIEHVVTAETLADNSKLAAEGIVEGETELR